MPADEFGPVSGRTAICLSHELIDIYCDSYAAPSAFIALDIDDTFDSTHGAQQLTFWNGFHCTGPQF